MSDPLIITAVFIGTLLIGVPVFVVLGVTAVVGLWLLDIPGNSLAQSSVVALQPFPLLALPLFILAGSIMERGHTAARLINVAQSMMTSQKGNLGYVTVIACAIFGAISGSGMATTAAVGSVTIPRMIEDGYSPRFASAVAASAGALGAMIPPSNMMIIYGLVASQSIPRLFLAGVIPGLTLALLLMVVVYFLARKEAPRETAPFQWTVFARVVKEGKWALGAPILILGGIYSGVFTPTEAAGVAVLYALFVEAVVYRELKWSQFLGALRFTTLMTGMLILLAPTLTLGHIIALYDMPDLVLGLLTSMGNNPLIFLTIVAVFYIIIGTFMDSLAQIVIFTPVLLPVAISLGIDPIFFGVFTIITAEIGFLTPPVGGNLYVAQRIGNVSLESISLAVVPFFWAYIAGLVIVTLWPELVLFLPDLVFGESR
ncbi:C4-dicarboxylate transporter, DctM subunit [Paracoccus alcaliphilus]|uniref:TRAP transporter large permease protein n=1 Tax=Paracoccus alcaliphilus TaxID=34002 RepID=A0A1H8NZL6_9RHOB|nr:TRAP transporter large permease [Paracoccus alcaliphilus]WCR21077.1 TRAP transporter large permease [Paracoccus alcaliphilus]SEO35110.1 C4-dicarboxylate transporter, DctM subunit [Paracoccus alcaliphilus]